MRSVDCDAVCPIHSAPCPPKKNTSILFLCAHKRARQLSPQPRPPQPLPHFLSLVSTQFACTHPLSGLHTRERGNGQNNIKYSSHVNTVVQGNMTYVWPLFDQNEAHANLTLAGAYCTIPWCHWAIRWLWWWCLACKSTHAKINPTHYIEVKYNQVGLEKVCMILSGPYQH